MRSTADPTLRSWLRDCWRALLGPVTSAGLVMVVAALVAIGDVQSTYFALSRNDWAAEGMPASAWLLEVGGYPLVLAVLIWPWLAICFPLLHRPARGLWRTGWLAVAVGVGVLLALRLLVIVSNISIGLAA